MSHFSSRSQVHGRGGILSHYILYLFIHMSNTLSQEGLSLLAFDMMYLQLLVALILAIFMMVCGGSHIFLGVHHWHQILISCFYLMMRCCGRKQVASTVLVICDLVVGQGGTVQVP